MGFRRVYPVCPGSHGSSGACGLCEQVESGLGGCGERESSVLWRDCLSPDFGVADGCLYADHCGAGLFPGEGL